MGGRTTAGVTVVRRPNLGYDFGSWATALDRYPAIATSPHVLLLNDSLVGPFASIDHLLERFHASAADVWAVTDTTQFRHHLQSYWPRFQGRDPSGTLALAVLASVRVQGSREDVIWRYEIGLSQLLDREKFVTDVAIPYWRVVGEKQNPTILGWRRLLNDGFPFVKRQLLREPQIAPDGPEVSAELRRRFDVEVDEWL